MPQKTVFVRDGDLDKWNAIEKKSEFIHNALSDKQNFELDKQVLPLHAAQTKVAVPIAAERLTKGLCKVHGLPLDARGRCLQKGCKYA